MIGEPDAGNLHVRFDEGMQETCVRVARLRPTLQSLQLQKKISFRCFSGRRFAHGQSRRSAPAGCWGRQLAGRILRHQVRAIADRQTSIEVLVNDDRLTGQRSARLRLRARRRDG